MIMKKKIHQAKYQNPKKVISIENKVFSTVDKNSIETNTANTSDKGKGKIFEFHTNLHYLWKRTVFYISVDCLICVLTKLT